jgi:hypothetical protein
VLLHEAWALHARDGARREGCLTSQPIVKTISPKTRTRPCRLPAAPLETDGAGIREGNLRASCRRRAGRVPRGSFAGDATATLDSSTGAFGLSPAGRACSPSSSLLAAGAGEEACFKQDLRGPMARWLGVAAPFLALSLPGTRARRGRGSLATPPERTAERATAGLHGRSRFSRAARRSASETLLRQVISIDLCEGAARWSTIYESRPTDVATLPRYHSGRTWTTHRPRGQ